MKSVERGVVSASRNSSCSMCVLCALIFMEFLFRWHSFVSDCNAIDRWQSAWKQKCQNLTSCSMLFSNGNRAIWTATSLLWVWWITSRKNVFSSLQLKLWRSNCFKLNSYDFFGFLHFFDRLKVKLPREWQLILMMAFNSIFSIYLFALCQYSRHTCKNGLGGSEQY